MLFTGNNIDVIYISPSNMYVNILGVVFATGTFDLKNNKLLRLKVVPCSMEFRGFASPSRGSKSGTISAKWIRSDPIQKGDDGIWSTHPLFDND